MVSFDKFDGTFFEPLQEIPSSEDYSFILDQINGWAREIYKYSDFATQAALCFCFQEIEMLRKHELSYVSDITFDEEE